MSTRATMQQVIDRLKDELATVRTGRANPALVTEVMVDSYGTMLPLKQVAQVATPDASTLLITPWDRSLLAAVEQALVAAELGMPPSNDGAAIRLSIPPMTEERRRELTKVVNEKLEEARVTLRQRRHEAISVSEAEDLPLDALKRRKEELTELAREFSEQAETIAEHKKQEIMTI